MGHFGLCQTHLDRQEEGTSPRSISVFRRTDFFSLQKKLEVPPAEFILGTRKSGDEAGDDLDDNTQICSCHVSVVLTFYWNFSQSRPPGGTERPQRRSRGMRQRGN